MRIGLVVASCLCVLSTACSTDPSSFGPLAVVEGERGNDSEAGISGRLVVNRECVLLDTGGHSEVMLIFREGQIEWDSEAEEVNVDGTSYTDGDRVALGGQEARSAAWVKAPDPHCLRDNQFEVHSARDG